MRLKFCSFFIHKILVWFKCYKVGDKDTPKHTIFMHSRNVWLGGTHQDFIPSKPHSWEHSSFWEKLLREIWCLEIDFCVQKGNLSVLSLVLVIGACRAVWVPGQYLATPHLMHNCGKNNYFVTTLYAIRTSVHIRKHAYTIYICLHVRSLWYEYAWFEISRACRRLWSLWSWISTLLLSRFCMN